MIVHYLLNKTEELVTYLEIGDRDRDDQVLILKMILWRLVEGTINGSLRKNGDKYCLINSLPS